MTSKARAQNDFLYPDVSREVSDQGGSSSKSRQITVFDAVAGRISAAGFIPKHVVISSTRDTASSSMAAVPPETVLFRRKNAPPRFMEADIYFSNEQGLPTELPDSDTLKALHCYTSEFYSRAFANDETGDYRSMDETALLALGVLMEEAARETIGNTGDLVFTEGEIDPEAVSLAAPTALIATGNMPRKKRRKFHEGRDH